MYASELKREAKNNFDVIDQKVRQSLRLTDGNMQVSESRGNYLFYKATFE